MTSSGPPPCQGQASSRRRLDLARHRSRRAPQAPPSPARPYRQGGLAVSAPERPTEPVLLCVVCAEGCGAREDKARVVDLLGIGHICLPVAPAQCRAERSSVSSFGRALLSAPRPIRADAPLVALDEASKAEILPCFERLRDAVSMPIPYVSDLASEVARLATTVVALVAGRVVAQGPAAEVLGSPAVLPAVLLAGAREAGAVLTARVARHHEERADRARRRRPGAVPAAFCRAGARRRPACADRAHDVILSCARPEGLSTLNILPGVVHDVRPSEGPGVHVALDTQAGRVLARSSRRSAASRDLAPGGEVDAVVKTVPVAPSDSGGGSIGMVPIVDRPSLSIGIRPPRGVRCAPTSQREHCQGRDCRDQLICFTYQECHP